MCTGKLLCVVGRDGTNHIYPTAWAVVCVENKNNWKWFLQNLQEDLHHEGGFGRTLMSDQHKVKKRKAEGEGESSALKKRKGQGKNGKGKGEGDTGSGIGLKMGEGECGSTSGVTKKNGKELGTLKLRKKSKRIIKKKLAKKVAGKNGEGDTSSKPMDLD
ncbi:unnamed protein product [Lactuca saligna]|uniref:MULE transposase domain-containing protein n=1 Tax=Lactuca saligna TaxID=75948 RepID=A0AA35ZS01_LACSI|nr:unnamed protein product [Lactuca saligna]